MKFFAWLFRMTHWNWALRWYGIFSAMAPEANVKNHERRTSPAEDPTPPEAFELNGNSLAVMPIPARAEPRIQRRMLVKLFDPEESNFEIARTVDVSDHGASVVSKRSWQPNFHLSVLSVSGKLYSSARVAYCRSRADGSYAVGLELLRPATDWAESNEDALRLRERRSPI